MRWLLPIFLFLLVYIEITLFIKVSDGIGVALTLLLVIATSCLGVSMVRQQGVRTLIQMQTKLSQGENPAAEMVKSVSLLIAGFLLLIPGFFTDFLGLLLLLPPVQKLLTLRMLPYIHVFGASPPPGFSDGNSQGQGGYTVEGEFERKNDEDTQRLDDKQDK
ncbi:Suppressor of F exclusion of phage T7 [Leminorella richardii]|uniref:Suppressor of F exclusion of phage T7 n=1 Tax=Leminorella richardii TaxID=158841 RepID=A0A2X4V670_9GAMM|nr:FxsA family protein [Leminorella richardii]SQI43688.1 Suppressor of F exclusion of phage T7 [Leminorella richardii]